MNELSAGQARNESLTVGTTFVTVSPTRPSRRRIYLKNISSGGQTVSVWFSDSGTATANTGVVLAANEYVIDEYLSEGLPCWKGNITAIASAAGATLAIYEVC